MRFVILALLALAPAFPQSLTLVMPSTVTPPGSSATVNVQLTNSTAATAPAITALQFDFTAPAEIGQVVIAVGPAAVAAGKQISCNIPAPGVNGTAGRCILWGLNVTAVGDGVVAIMTAPVVAAAKLANETLGILLGQASDANGNAVSVASMGGSFPVFTGCDLNRDGLTDIADVNVVVAAVIASPNGVSATCTASGSDLTKDGRCTVLDAYRSIVAALPASSGVAGAGACRVGP